MRFRFLAIVSAFAAIVTSAHATTAFEARVSALAALDPHQSADALGQSALALNPATHDEHLTAASLRISAGDALLAAGGDARTVVRLYDSAIDDLRSDGEDPSLIDQLRHMGEQLLAARQYEASERYLRAALKRLQDLYPKDSAGNDDPSLRFVLADLAEVFDREGDPRKAQRMRELIADLDSKAERVRNAPTDVADETPPAEQKKPGVTIEIPFPFPFPGTSGGSGRSRPTPRNHHGHVSPPPPPPPPVSPAIGPPPGQPGGNTFAPRSSARAQAAAPFQVVPVFFQTTRKPKGNYGFNTERNDSGSSAIVTSGIAYVSVPRNRPIGSVPRPSVWQLDFKEDAARHVILKDIEKVSSGEALSAKMRARLQKSSRGEALIFVHGFNQSFAAGVETAAALSVDLEIDGVTLAFSWPSKESLFYYQSDVDEANSEINRKALGDLLVRAAGLGARRVYVVAHSLGNRLLLKALTDAKSDLLSAAGGSAPFDHIVFGSADVESDHFQQQVRNLSGLSRHMTLYASSADRALLVSSFMHGGRLRAGDISANVPSTRFLDVIDATLASQDFLGHDDYAWLARDDLRAVVWFGVAATRRCLLQSDPLPRWKYSPTQSCTSAAFQLAAEYLRRASNYQQAYAAINADSASSAPVSASDFALAKSILQRLGQ